MIYFSRIPFPCQYEAQGCKAVLRQKDRRAHEVKCSKRLVHCGGLECKKFVPFSQFAEHWDNCRKSRSSNILSDGTVTNIDQEFNSITYNRTLKLGDKSTGQELTFIKISAVFGKFYYFWVFVNCTPEETLQFTADIYFDHGKKQELFQLGPESPLPVISIDIPLYDIVKNLALKISKKEFVVDKQRLYPWKVKLIQ